jgi:hypothetical protein
VLRKELQTLLSFTGGSRHQSLQNIVIVFLFFLTASHLYVPCLALVLFLMKLDGLFLAG